MNERKLRTGAGKYAPIGIAFFLAFCPPLISGLHLKRAAPDLASARGFAEFDHPRETPLSTFLSGLAVDAEHHLWVADTGNDRICRVLLNGQVGTAGERDARAEATPFLTGLNYPYGIAVDRWGNRFIADSGNHRILRADDSRYAFHIAGTGHAGDSGDGGPAREAQLNSPRGLAEDPMGNLFVADTENHRIRRISRDGIISTVAGTGKPGYFGDGGPAARSRLRYPEAVATDGRGSLFIADRGNNRIRKVTPDGLIRTVAGTGKAGKSGDGGPALQARLNSPRGIATDSQGDLFIADSVNRCVRKVDRRGIITTVAGESGPETPGSLAYPTSVALDGKGALYILDSLNRRVVKIPVEPPVGSMSASFNEASKARPHFRDAIPGEALADQ
jgi:sugar lactone lactonase YvrE